MERVKRTFLFLEKEIYDIEEKIKSVFEKNYNYEKTAQEKFALANSYYGVFLKHKIYSETLKFSPYEQRKFINIRENNWESLCGYLKNNFSKQNAEFLIETYKTKAEKETELHILLHSNIFKKLKVVHKERHNIKKETETLESNN